MKKLVRVGAGFIGGFVTCFTILFGPAGIVHGTAPPNVEPVQPSAVATPPPATPAPATAAPTAPPPPPTVAPTTTIPYYQIVEADCADFADDDALADRLNEVKGGNGSSHLVSMAKYCGVLFADQAEVDPALNRPRSNLEYASYTGDDPFFTPGNDFVTPNDAQIMIVVEVSTNKWNELHPPPTTVPGATTPVSSVTTVPSVSIAIASTTSPTGQSTPATTSPEGGEESGGSSDTVQIMGLLLLGAGAVSWGIYGVRSDSDG